MLTFSCGCGRTLELPEEAAGTTVPCPWCGRGVSVPGTAQAPDEPAPAIGPSDSLVELTTVSLAEAQALVGSLNAAGIPAIAWERDATYFGGASGAEVKVRPQDLAAARALLGSTGLTTGASARVRRIMILLAVILTLILIVFLARP